MSAPLLVGLAALISVNVVDAYFVGQLGPLQLAAMGFSFPVMFLATAFANGIGSGVQSVVSRAIGEGDQARARRVTWHGLLLALVLTFGLIVLGVVFMEPIFTVLGAGSETMPFIVDYMSIWFYALAFFVTPLVGGSALMARGDSTRPAAFLIGGAVLNGLLDPILIFGLGPVPALGIEGAALASAIARGIIAGLTIWVLFKDAILKPDWHDLGEELWSSWKSIARVSIPVTLNAVILPLSMAVLARLYSEFGPEAVAAYAAGSRIDAFALLVASAVGIGLAPIVGQNWGARLYGRVKRALALSEGVSIVWGALVWLLFFLGGSWIASVFIDDVKAAEFLALYLMIIPIGYAGTGVMMVCQQTLNAIDKAAWSTGLTILYAGTLVGLSALAIGQGEIEFLYIAVTSSQLIAGAVAFVSLRFMLGAVQD